MISSQETMLAMAVEGDLEALSALLQDVGPQLRPQLRIASRWQSTLDVDDVMQVTYLEAFIRIRHFKPDGVSSFTNWLRRIAENNLRDAVRSLGRMKRPPPDKRIQALNRADSAVVLIEQLGVSSTTPSRHAAAGELQGKLEAAIDALPEEYARAVRMYDLEHRPIDETAKLLNRSAGAVHMLRARAHDRLRELLGDESDFFSNSP